MLLATTVLQPEFIYLKQLAEQSWCQAEARHQDIHSKVICNKLLMISQEAMFRHMCISKAALETSVRGANVQTFFACATLARQAGAEQQCETVTTPRSLCVAVSMQ